MTIQTGSGFGVAPAYFSVRPLGTNLPSVFPVVVSESFLAASFVDVGDELRMPPLRIPNDNAVIVGTVTDFPATSQDLGEVFVLDFPSYQMMGYEPGSGIDDADFFWAAVDGPEEPIADALVAPPFSSFRLESEQNLVERLVSDPVALGTIGALTVGFVAAAVFAAVGFAVSATVSARERLVEFALLRALGLSPRQLGTWLLLEQGVLVIVSLALGTLLGALLTSTILPLVTLTQDGRPAVPGVIVQYPWPAIIWLEIAVVAVLGLIVAAMVALLRRVGLGSLLRMGED
jgi:ABC-type antimicrobial peptide transport system permease subunit